MMTDNTLKNPFNDPPGTVVTGKWHKNRYRLLKRLGAGANGAVYLAESAAGPVALKVGVSTAQVASESSVLKTISKARGQSLGPSFLEADDWERGREIIPGHPARINAADPVSRGSNQQVFGLQISENPALFMQML